MFPKMFKIASVASLTSLAAVGSAFAVDLEFYFPVAVGGAAATTIEKLTADYVAANPGVNIEAIYAGSYSDAGVKALTAARGGKPPQLSSMSEHSLSKHSGSGTPSQQVLSRAPGRISSGK